LHQKLELNGSCCRNRDLWAQCSDCIWAWILHMLCWFQMFQHLSFHIQTPFKAPHN
jgi:hypothetical protein